MTAEGVHGAARVVIVGGGTAGWMAAAALARLLPGRCRVTLVESDAIGIVGVGEATLPHLKSFNDSLGIDEAAFMAATHATFKLGISFKGWGRPGDGYLHPFAAFGRDVNGVGFHHFWTRARLEGLSAGSFQDYCLPAAMCAGNRFGFPGVDPQAPEAGFGYAYQFDTNLYGPFMRRFAEQWGVERIEGRVIRCERHAGTGDLIALALEGGARIEGDLFIDCSGFRSLLVGELLEEPFEDWSCWLPCDRAIAVPCATRDAITPYTSAVAMDAGWRWRIPLQRRTGNGHVFASAFVSDQNAMDALVRDIEGRMLADPRMLRFTAGRRRRAWVGNCVAIGLSGGFLEPLESTAIYLVQTAIGHLISHFPDGGASDADRDAVNRAMETEYDRIRDFLILHYHANQRTGSPFWDHMRTMALPDSLVERLALFRVRGRIEPYVEGLFLEPSWLSVLIGQNVLPTGYDIRAGAMPAAALERALHSMGERTARLGAAMPAHERTLADYCPAAGGVPA